jgi:hypothetical protein
VAWTELIWLWLPPFSDGDGIGMFLQYIINLTVIFITIIHSFILTFIEISYLMTKHSPFSIPQMFLLCLCPLPWLLPAIWNIVFLMSLGGGGGVIFLLSGLSWCLVY